MSSSSSKRILRKQLEMVHAAILEGDKAEEQGTKRKGKKSLGLSSGPKRRKLTTREQIVHEQELKDKKQDLTLYNLRALVPADTYVKVAAKVREEKRSKNALSGRGRFTDDDIDEYDDQQYAEEASSAAAAAAAMKLESTYEDATLGEYMKSIKRLRGETPEQFRRKRARIQEAELAASVDVINRDDVPLKLIQQASEQNPIDFDESDEEGLLVKRKKKKQSSKARTASKKQKKMQSEKAQKAASKKELEEAKLAMSVPSIARAAKKQTAKKH